jgi:PPOX class probable F420-dependent enzyme
VRQGPVRLRVRQRAAEGRGSAVLTDADRAFLADARRATLATIASDGRPRLVPICFIVADDVVWTPLDEKPKVLADVRDLARVRDIARDARVTMLVDRWSEDWAELGWLRVEGHAELVETADPGIVAALRARYPQYASHDLERRPLIRITIDRLVGWSASPTQPDAPRRPIE